MSAPAQNSTNPTTDIEALSAAFASFVKVTEDLRSSYERLRQRAEQIDIELANANERLRQKVDELDHLSGHLDGILSAIPSGVIVSDMDGKITRLNTAAEKILGLQSDECIGKKNEEVCDVDGKSFLLGHAKGNSSQEITRECKSRQGERIVLGGGTSWIRDKDGKTVGHVEIVEDLSLLWELREKVHRLDKLAALGEMSAVIAHEIRNPLNGVQGFADLLAKKLKDTDPKTATYASNIVRGVREVDAIIADLLSFASNEKFVAVGIELNALLEQTRDTVVRGSIPTDSKFEFTIQPPALRVRGDAIKLGQVFRNLFSNSIEAMPQGNTISVRATQEANRARILVQDQGPGIPADVRKKIFEPFFTTKTQGTGLGLAIVRKLVELHGGTISLCEVDKGSCFELTIPAVN